MGYHFKDNSPACTPEIDYGTFWMEGLGQDLSGSLQGAGGIGGAPCREQDHPEGDQRGGFSRRGCGGHEGGYFH